MASYDSQWVVSGLIDRSVLFGDARTAQAQFALHGHDDFVMSLDVSPTEGFFATGVRTGLLVCVSSEGIGFS